MTNNDDNDQGYSLTLLGLQAAYVDQSRASPLAFVRPFSTIAAGILHYRIRHLPNNRGSSAPYH